MRCQQNELPPTMKLVIEAMIKDPERHDVQ